MAKTDWVDGEYVHGSDMNTLGTEVAAATSANAVNASALAGKQPLDADLTTIAGISPANDDVLQRKSGAWTNRTPTQLKSDLTLNNVDNTADTGKPVSTAQQTALNLKANLASPTFTGTVAGVTKSHVGLGNVDNVQQQPLDSDLTAIAALTTTSFGRSLLTSADAAATRSAVGTVGAEIVAPVFTVSTFYGGTLGGSDDTACIQATLDACHAAGGGVVFLPANLGGTMWKAEQLIMRDGVLFKGAGWHSYALDGYTGGSKLQQLTGVNDDLIVIPGTGVVENDKFAISCGITDMSLRGAAGSTAGHAINFRKTTGAGIGPQDLTTLERIYGIGFAGSVIHTTNAVPFSVNYITGVGNGGYVIEVEETADPTVGLANQVVLQNLSGDANMGYDDTGESGAVVCLTGIKNQYSPAISIFGVKSEYRAQSESGVGGAVLGNFNAVLIDSCNCPISITGVNHLGHHATKKCGDAIRIIGDVRPDLAWQSVNVKTFAGQVSGAAPFAVHDEPSGRGISVPHGYWGDLGITADKIVAADGKVVEFEARTSSVNSIRFSARATTVPPFIEVVGPDTNIHLAFAGKGTGGLLVYQNSGNVPFILDGSDTNIGVNFTTKGTGRVQENGNTAASWVAVPSTATSTGKVGQMAADSSFLYTCTATNTWRRVAHASW